MCLEGDLQLVPEVHHIGLHVCRIHGADGEAEGGARNHWHGTMALQRRQCVGGLRRQERRAAPIITWMNSD